MLQKGSTSNRHVREGSYQKYIVNPRLFAICQLKELQSFEPNFSRWIRSIWLQNPSFTNFKTKSWPRLISLIIICLNYLIIQGTYLYILHWGKQNLKLIKSLKFLDLGQKQGTCLESIALRSNFWRKFVSQKRKNKGRGFQTSWKLNFLAVQDSSIGDLVTDWVTHFDFRAVTLQRHYSDTTLTLQWH